MAVIFEHPVTILLIIMGVGYYLGNLHIKQISFGASAILFIAMVFGYWGISIPAAFGELGVILFVYSIGLQTGPRFFHIFKKRGIPFAKIAFLITLSGALTTLAFMYIFDIPVALALGIFTGALTSTPGLAAALDAVKDPAVSVGYGLAYPFGVIGVVLFVQLLPRFLKVDMVKEDKRIQKEEINLQVTRRQFVIQNPNLAGRTIRELKIHQLVPANLSRIKKGTQVSPVGPDTVLEIGDIVTAVGSEDSLNKLQLILGHQIEDQNISRSTSVEYRDLILTREEFSGKPLSDLKLWERFGILITRVRREGMEFTPLGDFILDMGDSVRIVGEPSACENFLNIAGQHEKKIHETNMLALSLGILLGIFLGFTPIQLPGGLTFRLGLAGGPLLVGLMVAHFGKIGNLNIRTPYAAKFILRELGLALFLAHAGVQAGKAVEPVLNAGALIFVLSGMAVTILPMLAGFLISKYYFKYDVSTILGVIAGGMTSTPALGAISNAVVSDRPALAYAAVYPVALIAVTVFSQLLPVLF